MNDIECLWIGEDPEILNPVTLYVNKENPKTKAAVGISEFDSFIKKTVENNQLTLNIK